jgi:D-xylose transport system substrate-binding protein
MVVFALVISFVLSGCHSTKDVSSTTKTNKDDNIQIGVSFDTFVVERWQRDRDIFVDKVKELGAEVNVQSANGSAKEQKEQIDYFIEQKMDVIVIVAIDSDVIQGSVKRALAQGIKVIAYDRLIPNANVDLYISFDNVKVGQLMAQSLIDNTKEGGNIIGIFGPTSDYNVTLVMEGFTDAIQDSSLNLIYTTNAEGWLAEQAFTAVNDAIEFVTKNGNITIDGVMCGNDNLATQAVLALSEHRLAGQVSLVGQDADLNACQRIVEGTQTMTVYKPVDILAKAAAEYAVLLGKGEELDITDTFNDGTYDIPYQKLDPIAVTVDNIDEVIIDGGFHLREDVYLNVN